MTALPALRPRSVTTRPATPADMPAMISLMAPFIAVGDLLPRAPGDLLRDIDWFTVAVSEEKHLVGTGALKLYPPRLAEVIALAIAPTFQGQGVGQAIVERLVARAAALGVTEVFALTRRPGFFHRLGFSRADKSRFPEKVWSDCSRCPRQHCCDETAVHLLDVASRSPSA